MSQDRVWLHAEGSGVDRTVRRIWTNRGRCNEQAGREADREGRA